MTGEISRRRALQAVALGAASTLVGGIGTWRTFVSPGSGTTAASAGEALRQPEVLTSRDGTLDVRLVASSGATVAGRRTQAFAYNGSVPGPTVRVRPGDRLRIDLVNDLPDATNLHTHGLHVSPEGNSDNVFRHVAAGETAAYEYAIPEDHPAGTFWYHPHMHGSVADQVFAGLYGAIVVEGPGEPEVVRERVLVVSDISLTADGRVAGVSPPQVMAGREGDLLLVNGQVAPRVELVPGQTERWRVVNACASRFLDLGLDGHTLGLLGHDGQALGAARQRDSVQLAPGNRVDLLVTPTSEGEFTLRTGDVDRGGMGMMGGATSGAASLATVVCGSGAAAAATAAPAAPTRTIPDLRGETVDGGRTIRLTMAMGGGMGGMGGMSFGFDGKEFDPGRVDQEVSLGGIEEWTIVNTSPMDHPFHLHVWPMQVVDGAGVDASGPPEWRDVVNVPAGGQVRVRIRFADFGGRTVYHCHILDHEDNGMMAVVLASGAARDAAAG